MLEGSVSAARAYELGLASELLPSDIDTRALQFANWLVLQSQVGLMQVLGLTLGDATTDERDALAEQRQLWSEELTESAPKPTGHAPGLVLSSTVDPHSPELALSSTVDSHAPARAVTVRELIAAQRVQSKPVLEPSQVDPPSVSRYAGIHALEVYTPRQCVSAAELERAHNIVGKYTEGLMMREFAACDEDENVVTMALTVLSRLVETHGLRYKDIGVLQVGSESLLDRSKSIKTHLMQLFDASANHGVEGVDNYQACYGGTAALFACTNWVESEAYDGRWAIAVTTDTAEGTKQYPFLNGAAAVAILVGPDAPLVLEGKPQQPEVCEACL